MFQALLQQPFTAVAEEGHVLLEGHMVAVTLKPADALFIAEQLIIAAAHATAQDAVT